MKNLVKTEGRWYDAMRRAEKIVAAAHRAYAHAEGMNALLHVLQQTNPGQAAGTDATLVIGVVPSSNEVNRGNSLDQTWSVTRMSLTSGTLMTGATATAVTFTIGYSRAGAAPVAIGTYVTITGTDLTANVEKVVAITTPPVLLAGDVITLVTTHASTGIAVPAGVVAKVELHLGPTAGL
jgi:hypothetical protein